MTDLEAIKALADAATPGPWAWYGVSGVSSPLVEIVYDLRANGGCYSSEDAKFIAAARTAVPELIAEVERLQSERDELRAHIERFDRRSCMECDFSGPDTDEVIKGWKE